jgi:iron complex outermembrane receptor protein
MLLLSLEAAGQSRFSGDDGAGIEEIVVTARKLAENISRVPMSVQALSGDFLDRRNVTSLYDLQFDVPGLVVTNRGMFGAGISLRGVTDEGGTGLAIAPHVNGVYLGRSNVALARQFDVERVEVVKGPQGTLYGRNATGGSINVITRAPQPELGAAAEIGVASFDTARIQGHLNVPAENVAARFAVVGSQGDGFIRNSVDDRRFGEEDYLGVRASLRMELSDALSIDVTAERVEDDGANGELWLPRPDYLPDPNDIRLTTVTLANPHLIANNDVVSLDLTFDFAGLTLRSISGYARNVTNALDDCAGFPALRGCVRGVQPLRYEQLSQELRLESGLGSRLHWLGGAYFLDADQTQEFQFSAPGLGAGPINDDTSISQEAAYALFGDATYALGARWSVSGGLRLSHDEQRVSAVGQGSADPPTLLEAKDSWDDTSWRLGIEFVPLERLLVYASVSTGFKSGGITTSVLPNGQFDAFEPENLLAYEAGVNVTPASRRFSLRASAFYYDFKDMQVQTTAVLESRVVSVIDNAAAARIYGLDASATTRISDRVTISGALIYMPEREFVEFVSVTSGGSLSGNTLSRAPEWSVSASVAYGVPIGAAGQLSVEADYNHRSEFFFTKENNPLLAQASFGLLNVSLRFVSSPGRWHAFASVRNALDSDYFTQVMIQSSAGYPVNYEVGFGWRL